MIVIVTTHSCRSTHDAIDRWPNTPDVRRWSYWRLFESRSLPAATYVFTDFDRLGPWELELAAHLYRRLREADLRVLNDPALFLNRHGLLDKLRREALSSVHSWLPALGVMPDRFPAFLRTQAAHRGPITDLLQTPDDARQALDDALAAGYALNDLHFVEYAAAPSPEGFFCKYATFRIGDALFPALTVFTKHWVGRQNDDKDAPASLYAQELKRLEDDPYANQIAQIFDAANIDYGRIDFGVVDGQIKTYEINLNPWIGGLRSKPDSVRPEIRVKVRERYIEALRRVDSGDGGKAVALDGYPFRHQRRKDLKTLRTRRWNP